MPSRPPISVTHPHLVSEWIHARNIPKAPDSVSAGSVFRAWWRCAQGHEWAAIVSNRARYGTGCPYCAGRLVTPETSLAAVAPELAAEWHSIKNEALTPCDVLPHSARKVWWICSSGHEYFSAINKRSYGRGCPVCSRKVPSKYRNLETEAPEVAKQWHPDRNGALSPSQVLPKSNKLVWWRCEKGHEWQARVYARLSSGCPDCHDAKRLVHKVIDNQGAARPAVLRELFPKLISEIDVSLEDPRRIGDEYPGSYRRVAWQCPKGHKWVARICKRTAGQNCPFCSNKRIDETNSLLSLRPEMALEWDSQRNGNLSPGNVGVGSGKRVWWICSRGHRWKATIYSRCQMGSNCPQCNPRTSRTEIRVLCELRKLVDPEALWRKKIAGFEADIFLVSRNLVVEVDGFPWHAGERAVSRDARKTLAFSNAGYRVIRVREQRLAQLSGCVTVSFTEASILYCCKMLIREILSMTDRDLPLPQNIQSYLDGNAFAAQAEYESLVAALPGPEPGYALSSTNPELIDEWDVEKNAPLEISKVHRSSSVSAWWRCKHGHSWRSSVANRSKGHGCPFCAGVRISDERRWSVRFPDLVREWNSRRNGGPAGETNVNMNSSVWWVCEVGHEWQTAISNRTRLGTGCPFCKGKRPTSERNLQTLYPDVSRLFDCLKNDPGDPRFYLAGSEKPVWWKCPVGHSWQRSIAKQVKSGERCPFCAGRTKVALGVRTKK